MTLKVIIAGQGGNSYPLKTVKETTGLVIDLIFQGLF